jgi:DNA-directed RNA polymerase specialized sigma24 family protein
MGINDVLHEVLLSLSKTNFDNVLNIEHYIMRAIKLQCWSLLDKAIKKKAFIANNDGIFENEGLEKDPDRSPHTGQNEQLQEIEGAELLVQISLFKQQLKENDVRLLNLLIDETERSEIAKLFGINLNTLDTNIRRLRIKAAEYLRGLGYIHEGINRFS